MDIALSPKTKAWLDRYGTPLKGKSVLLTGATGSLGRYACAELAYLGARLVLPERGMEKGQLLADALHASYPDAEVELETVDMASFASVDALSARLLARGEPLDVVVNNAGVFSRAGIRTEDGFELHQQTNALCPLRLTRALLPLMRLSQKPRVVTVTSLAAWNAKPLSQNPLSLKSGTQAYGLSKLKLMRGVYGLAADAPDVQFVFAHPGISATDLFRAGAHPTAYGARLMRLVLPVMGRVFMKPEKAALTTVYAVCAACGDLVMSAPKGLMGVWGYPHIQAVWKRIQPICQGRLCGKA